MNELADRPLRVADESVVIHWLRLLRWFANLRLVPRWREDRARIVIRALRRYYYEGLTRPGKILFLCSFLIFLFSYRIGSDYLLLTAACGGALLAWSVSLGFLFRPRVSLQRDTPATAVAGQLLTSRIHLHNESRVGLYNFSLREMVVPFGRWPREWARPHCQLLAAGQHSTVAVSFEPQKRGLLMLSGVAVHSYYPFFLTRFTQRVPAPAEVYVLPPTLKVSIPSLRHVAETASKKLKFGTDNTRKGPSLEYSHSRGYQVGDSLRRLDHRASSRLGEPMSKVFEGAEEVRRDQVYLMVDLTLNDFQRWQRRPENDTPLDRRLALAVEIGLSAQNEGFTLSALATGSEWHVLDNTLDFYQHIATCQAERAVERADSFVPQAPLNDGGLHILVVGKWTPEKKSLLERWQKNGVLCLVFLLPESASDAGSLPVGAQFVEISENGGSH